MNQEFKIESQRLSGCNFINNEFVEPKTGKVYERTNPVDGSKIGVFADSCAQDAEIAIEAAALAFKSWSRTSYDFRGEMLVKLAKIMVENTEELSQTVTMELGKTITESLNGIKFASDVLMWFAYETKRIHGQFINVRGKKKMIVNHKPHGVVGFILSYNSPIILLLRSLAAILGAGCTVVLKPATKTPLTVIKMAMLCKEVGFPPGVINVVTTDYSSAPSVGSVLCSHPLVRHISFTGSTSVGKQLMAQLATTVKRCTMNMSGNSPAIVFKSAHISKCVQKLIASKIYINGQCVVAPNRIFVQSEIYDDFLRVLIQTVSTLKAGNPMDKSSQMSCLVDQKHFDSVDKIVELAKKQGAELVYQGEKVVECGPYYFPPTILTQCKTSMDISQCEIFGPVFAIYKFENETEVLEEANKGTGGVGTYIYSEDIDQILRAVDELEYGLMSVNNALPFEKLLPFGGLGESGIGTEAGLRCIYRYMDEQSIIISHE